MSKLSFNDYIELLTIYVTKYREIEGDHRGSIRWEPLPMRRNALIVSLPPLQPSSMPLPPMNVEENLGLYGPMAMQMAPPPYVLPSVSVGYQQQHYGGGYGDAMGGYYFGMYGGGDGGGASSAQYRLPSFDPYAAYK